jgi:hypothetical protein
MLDVAPPRVIRLDLRQAPVEAPGYSQLARKGGAMKAPANPEKRADIKWTDEDVMKNITDRTNKVKTSTPLEPQNTGFKGLGEAVSSFKETRERLIGYVNITKDDLRNHVTTLGPGSFDCYQVLLFIGAHSNRHVEQMKEVMADPNFPKK